MKELIKNNIIFFVLIIVVLFNQNILIFLGNINKMMLKDNDLRIEEITILKNENRQLKSYLNDLETINNLKHYNGLDYEISNIIIRNIYQIYETITIEKGTNFGIKKGMAVINEDGLVGTIIDAKEKTSEVLLITSNKNDISIKVGEAFGILSSFENGFLVASKISNYEDFNIGDSVYTSGLGNLPANLYIGKVKEIKPGDYNIEQKIYIESNINIENIKYLMVVKSIKGE